MEFYVKTAFIVPTIKPVIFFCVTLRYLRLDGIINIFWKKFLWKKERFPSAGYGTQDFSIAGSMLYHLSYYFCYFEFILLFHY